MLDHKLNWTEDPHSPELQGQRVAMISTLHADARDHKHYAVVPKDCTDPDIFVDWDKQYPDLGVGAQYEIYEHYPEK